MPIGEAVFGGAVRMLVSITLSLLGKAPDVALTYGKSGANDLVRMHYRRTDPRPVAYPWVIVEARSLWPFNAPLLIGDEEGMSRPTPASRRTGLHLKPDRGVVFIPLRERQEFPAAVYLLLRIERSLPAERRWIVAKALRPSRFDLRFPERTPSGR